MAFLDDILGGMSPEVTAAQSTPTDFRAMFSPIMQAIAEEAKRKSDPVQRLYDVGGAIHSSVASGQPFDQTLASFDAERRKAVSGAGNLFLTLMGQERQVQELKAQERRHQEDLGVRREQMQQQGTLARERMDIDRRGQDLTLKRAEAADARTREMKGFTEHDAQFKMARTTLTPDKQQEFDLMMSKNLEYNQAKAAGDWQKANEIAAMTAKALGPKSDLPADLRVRSVAYRNVLDASDELKGVLSKGASVIDPTDRAEIRRVWKKMVLQYGIATGRGANFTEMEKDLVENVLGMNPLDLKQRSVETIRTYLQRQERFRKSLEKEMVNLKDVSQKNPTAAPPDKAPSYAVPQGYKPTGRTTRDGRPIYVTPEGREVAPKLQ